MKKSGNPLVSVLVTTRNSADQLETCLRSLKKQSYANVEIIVVDNNSTDNTKSIARSYTKHVYNRGPERSTQRNFAAKKVARGKYLLFLDSDMSISKSLIQVCVYNLETKKDIVGLYIRELVTGTSFWSRVRRFERSFYDATAIDGLRFLRKDIFLKSGGFDEKLYACEDWDLDKRIKKYGRVDFISTPLYHNESKFDIKKYLDKKYYYSVNFNTYIRKWGKNDPDIKKQFGPSYRLFWVFVESNKWKRIVKHPFLALCMLVLRLLASWKYILIRLKVDI